MYHVPSGWTSTQKLKEKRNTYQNARLVAARGVRSWRGVEGEGEVGRRWEKGQAVSGAVTIPRREEVVEVVVVIKWWPCVSLSLCVCVCLYCAWELRMDREQQQHEEMDSFFFAWKKKGKRNSNCVQALCSLRAGKRKKKEDLSLHRDVKGWSEGPVYSLLLQSTCLK